MQSEILWNDRSKMKCALCPEICDGSNAALAAAGWGTYTPPPDADGYTSAIFACATHKDAGTTIVEQLVGKDLEDALIRALTAHADRTRAWQAGETRPDGPPIYYVSTRDIACMAGGLPRPRSTVRSALHRLADKNAVICLSHRVGTMWAIATSG